MVGQRTVVLGLDDKLLAGHELVRVLQVTRGAAQLRARGVARRDVLRRAQRLARSLQTRLVACRLFTGGCCRQVQYVFNHRHIFSSRSCLVMQNLCAPFVHTWLVKGDPVQALHRHS